MKNQSKGKFVFLYTLTLVNHAFVSWLIVYMRHLFPLFSHMMKRGFNVIESSPFLSNLISTQAQWESICFGLLLSVKPLGEAIMVWFWSKNTSLSSRFTLLSCVVLSAVSCLSFIVGIYFKSVAFLLFAQLLLGLSCSAIFLIQVILTALSTFEERTSTFNFMEWSVGLGMSFGPLIGSVLVSIQSAHSSLLPFMFVFLINLMMIAFCLRSIVPGTPLLESVAKRKKRPYSISRWYLLSWLCFQFSFQGYYHWFPSLMKINFNFTHAQLAAFYTWLGLFYIFCQFFLVRLFSKKNIHRFVVMLSMPVMGFSFVVMGLCQSLGLIYLASALYMLAVSFYLPFWKAYLSFVGAVSSLNLFASMTILTCLCAVVSTAVSGVFAAFSMQLLFVLFGVVMICGVVFFFLIDYFLEKKQL